MRVTNNQIFKKYLTNLNKNLNTLNKLSDQTSTQRQFSKASEDPTAALKVFKIKRDLSKISTYKSNALDLKNNLADLETSISSINEIAIEVNTLIIQGENKTYDEYQRKIIADVLRNIQKQILNNGNANFGGKYIFGGTDLKNPPLTVDGSGKLLYKGVDVDTGVFNNDTTFVDIGTGMANIAGSTNENNAFIASYSGVKLLGSGVDADGISNNMYNIIGEIATAFENNDLTNMDKLSDKFKSKMNDILVQYADVGEKSNYIEFISNKLDLDEENAMTKQDSLETADLTRSIMDYKYQEMAYNASLQLGSKILQSSLFDYMR